jgi:hypothetical protein
MKILKSYTCEICAFVTSNKNDYGRHITTRKHQERENGYKKTPITATGLYCCDKCNKQFKSRTSIYRHKPICDSIINKKAATFTNTTTGAGVCTGGIDIGIGIGIGASSNNIQINEIVAENMKMKAMMIEMIKQNNHLQTQMLDLYKTNMIFSSNANNGAGNGNPNQNTYNASNPCSAGVTSHNNLVNINTVNNTNCNNPTFNLNLFLNEKCKDAMNIQEFVNSIQLNMTDLENVGKLGYVEGISNIIIDNLQKTDLYKRPVHCSDVKRETLYVKDDNKWEKEGPEHQKMVNAVLAVEHKNIGLMGEWAAANPKCMNSGAKENNKYFKLSRTVTDGERNGNIAKVIRRVAKNVVIDK